MQRDGFRIWSGKVIIGTGEKVRWDESMNLITDEIQQLGVMLTSITIILELFKDQAILELFKDQAII